MKLKIEVFSENKKALIVSKINYDFIDLFKSNFKKFSVETYFSTTIPKSFNVFDYIFIFDDYISNEKIEQNSDKKYVFIFIKKNPPFHLIKNNSKNIKIIKLNNSNITEKEIDKILWFAFSSSKEKLLKIDYLVNKEKKIPKKNNFIFYLNKKKIFLLIIFIFFLYNILFFPFILISSFFTYKSLQEIKKENFNKVNFYLPKSKKFLFSGKKLYYLVDANYKLLGLSKIPENIIDINNNLIIAIDESLKIIENIKKIQQLIFTKNKSQEEKDNLKLRLSNVYGSIEKLNKSIDIVNQKLDLPFKKTKEIKKNLLEINDLISKSKNFYKYFQKIISQETTSKYLLFFANNMELRPGGGFLGSFAVLEIGNFEVKELKIYDVYDADGQLKAHLDPPKPLEKYLNLPHWFLRDSNFSPDFFQNYQKALFFLEKSIDLSGFNGSVLLTTSAVENILNAFENIYLPDYKEYINAKNFYLKTQLYVEKNFFPGSIQKKTFLSKLTNQIIINLDQASFLKLFKNLKKSLDEKQIVIYLDDENIQNIINSLFWSGRVIEPKCFVNNNCILDYLFPYDANVGTNKANFFVNRFFYLKTSVDLSSAISHQLIIKYENNSPSEIFPTGYYRNYFQILLPRDVVIKSITKDGVLIEDYDEKDDVFKLIGFYFEIPPKKTTEIKINYQLNQTLQKGNQIYQLIFQKQIGDKNSDLILDFRFNENISLINQNFSPLVKNNQIIYNTSLSTDKIFLIEIKNK